MNKQKLKSYLELMVLNKIWIEPASDLNKVAELIQKLHPVSTQFPLLRIGSEGDGAYLVPDDLDGLTACVSPGVSTEVSFDLAMAERGLEVYMADASVEGPPLEHERFHFTKKFLDVFEDEQNLRLDTLCKSIPDHLVGDRILQMDIEGAEYRVLLDASDESLKGFRIILLEFHDLDGLFARFPSAMIMATFSKLLRHFSVVHIHPNNACGPTTRGDLVIPPVMEFTFLRKDRIREAHGISLAFPHPLDRDNVPERPPVLLPDCWRK